jgi:hypothetical protein
MEVTMEFEHPLPVRPALVAVAVAVAVSAVASSTVAAARFATSPTGGEVKERRGQVAVLRRPVGQFRGRYQLRLTEARGLLA